MNASVQQFPYVMREDGLPIPEPETEGEYVEV